MKLPRWLMITMLTSSVLAVLGAAGWWWVTWPERTAREFVELLRDGRESEEEWLAPHRSLRWERDGLRGPMDLLCARLRFRIIYDDGGSHETIISQRGSIETRRPE